MGKEIELVERNVGYLKQLDWDKPDHKITMTEFTESLKTPEALYELTGVNSLKNWQEFKHVFIAKQMTLGFIWAVTRGQGGPISLSSVELSSALGEELARGAFSSGIQEGDFYEDVVATQMPVFWSYLGESDVVDLSSAREGFKEPSHKNTGYKFKPGRGSTTFQLAIEEYCYKGSESRTKERELGELIKEEVKSICGLTEIDDTQLNRLHGKYLNADFEGFRIRKDVEGDSCFMYCFELKAGNSIKSISEAISQASNYKGKSHFSYIIIPLFDQYSFHDEERFNDLVEMCRANGVGILSVDMNPDTHEVKRVTEVLPAKKLDLIDATWLLRLVSNFKWLRCPLCRNIVDNERTNCGWLLELNEEKTECMKILMEKSLLNGTPGLV